MFSLVITVYMVYDGGLCEYSPEVAFNRDISVQHVNMAMASAWPDKMAFIWMVKVFQFCILAS